MPSHFPPDVDQFVKQQIASGACLSEDELITEALRRLRQEREEEQADLQAIREGIEAWQNGDAGMPLDDAFQLSGSRRFLTRRELEGES